MVNYIPLTSTSRSFVFVPCITASFEMKSSIIDTTSREVWDEWLVKSLLGCNKMMMG